MTSTQAPLPTSVVDSDTLDAVGAAALLWCSVRKLHELTRAGKVPSSKLGGRRIYRRSAIMARLAELEAQERARIEQRLRDKEAVRHKAAGLDDASQRAAEAAREAVRERAASRGISVVRR